MLSKEALHCAAQHLKCYLEDEKYKRTAGTTVSCQTCDRLDECDCNRHKYLENELRKETGVSISFMAFRQHNNMDNSILTDNRCHTGVGNNARHFGVLDSTNPKL